ncbi:MAG: calcium/sodium antiporter [Pseudomonadota bacterium]
MLTQIIFLIIGIILLYVGSWVLVEGSVSTAVMFAVRPVIIGLTIVSLATSAPELLVSLVAAFKGSNDISMGNIIGSNVINIALVLGVSAAIKPIDINPQIIKIDIPYMIVVSFVFWLLCLDSQINRMDGVILLVLLALFLIYGLITAKDRNNKNGPAKLSMVQIIKNIGFIVSGIVMLAYGANFIVQEAIQIATQMGLSQTFIGISVVALGTSLPELATSAVAASKGESDISVGNVVGSNLFNICLVMGTVGVFNPMSVDINLHYFQFPFMGSICLLLGIVAYRFRRISKFSGYFFIFLFIYYICISYLK